MHRLRPLFAKLPPAWRWSLPVWLAARLGLSLWGALLASTGFFLAPPKDELFFGMQPITGGLVGALVGVWQRWDAIAYQRIIVVGYHSSFDLSAYFPLYPMLARLLRFMTGMEAVFALLVVSSLAVLFLLVTLYELAAKDFSIPVARAAVVVAAIFPSAFFFFAPYPQSLLLLFTLLAYRFLRQQRYGLASLAALGAGLTHSTVVPLAILLGMHALLQLPRSRTVLAWRNLIAFLPAAAPFAGVGLFLAWRAWQGFVPITELMQYGWQRVMQWPWVTAGAVLQCFRTGRINTNFVIDLILITYVIALSIWSWKKIPWPQWLYQVSLLIYLGSTSSWGQPLTGFSRYMLAMFPVFICSGLLCRYRAFRMAGFAISLGLLLLLSGVYFMWGWIA